jgi:hypothetical protein
MSGNIIFGLLFTVMIDHFPPPCQYYGIPNGKDDMISRLNPRDSRRTVELRRSGHRRRSRCSDIALVGWTIFVV